MHKAVAGGWHVAMCTAQPSASSVSASRGVCVPATTPIAHLPNSHPSDKAGPMRAMGGSLQAHARLLACTLLVGFHGLVSAGRLLKASPAADGVTAYDWHVTVSRGAPDCYEKDVILVNGVFQPTLEVVQGGTLVVNVFNDLPADYPTVSDGISIHWHGFSMHGAASWYDGVSYADQCPIVPSANFTYSFKVDEPPGTYLWHDHSAVFKADGFQGALIVHPPAGSSEPWSYDGDYTMMVSDWWHAQASPLAMRLNRPFDPSKVTNDSGAWVWVGNPQGILINGKGFYGDCVLFPKDGSNTNVTTCTPTTFTVPVGRSAAQPWAPDTNPGCTHESFTVEHGKTYRFRIIGGTELLYQTVCFEGHNVTVIAADAVPIDPVSLSCLDVEPGQRYDVLLTANQPPANYWISVQQQYRTGAPTGFAVLNYQGAPNQSFPNTTAPPSNVQPWGFSQVMQFKTNAGLVNPSSSAPGAINGSLWLEPQYNLSTLAPPNTSNHFVEVNITQPLFDYTGQLRWALDNVMMPTAPTCSAYKVDLYNNPNWLQQNLAGPGYNDSLFLGDPVGNGTAIRVYSDGQPAPIYPTVGIHVVQINEGDVVDVLLVSLPANANNGDYRPNNGRNATEQHPFHLHGHRFWVLGTGLLPYDPKTAQLNLVNPQYRDTIPLLRNAWVLIRFKANNPGVWPFHCHILWHHFMGQQLHFVESIKDFTPPPADLPKCNQQCIYNTNPFTKSWVKAHYGNSGFELP